MEANELRIGNKVKCKISNDHGIYTVLALPGWENGAVEFMVTIDRCPKQTVKMSQLKPIIITEQLLKDYGFACDIADIYWHYHDRNLFPRGCRFVRKKFLSEDILLKKPFLRFDGLVDVHYLHQLQNWFYILSKGVELDLYYPIEKLPDNSMPFF